MKSLQYKNQVIKLRKKGMTYAEIQSILNMSIPKSTLSHWCKNIKVPDSYKKKLKDLQDNNLYKARVAALQVLKEKNNNRDNKLFENNKHLSVCLLNKDVAKIILSILYLEGTRKQRSSLTFGNSDPLIISLFLKTLRFVYKIDESKFRCTLQCRADQNIDDLQNFWSNITSIPLNKFYKARIDPRSVGKESKNLNYKGVCRINYFSAEIFNELMIIIKIIGKNN